MPDVSLNGIEFKIRGSSNEASASVQHLIDKVNELRSSMSGLKSVQTTANALKNVGNAAKKAATPLSNFASSLKRIAFYRILRGILKSITQAFKEGLKNAYEFSKATGDQAGLAAALDQLATKSLTMKNQLGAAFGGLLTAVMPIILELISLVTKLASAISMLFGMFNGKGGYLQAKDVWTEWGDAAESAGGAAKKALEYLAPFDELNVLPDPKSGGGGGSASNIADMFDFVEFEEGSMGQKISDFISENLEAVEAVAHLFEFAIGLIMVCSNPASLIGWGLLAHGAYKLWQDGTVNWDAISTQLQGSLGGVTAIASGALLALGAVLTFSGVAIPLGIGLMAAGAIGLAATVAANWDTIKKKLQGPVGEATALISGASLLLGILLCVGGMFPLGIGLIAAGAAGLASTVAVNWDKLKEIGKTAKEKVKAGWDAAKEKFDMAVQLVKDGWTNVKKWVTEKGQKVGEFVSSAIKLAKTGWTTVKSWIEKDGLGGAVSKGIGLIRQGWSYISTWITEKWMGKSTPNKGIGIIRQGWDYVSTWIKDKFMGKSTPEKAIGIIRNGWTTIGAWISNSFMGDALSKGIGLAKSGWETVTKWISNSFLGSALNKGIGLAKSGWKTVYDWMISNKYVGQAIQMGVELIKKGWTNFVNWILGKDQTVPDDITQNVDIKVDDWSINPSISDSSGRLNLPANVDIQSVGGSVNAQVTVSKPTIGVSTYDALGGAFYGGNWHSIPQYASGGAPHGSLFVAGEAGAELVGHIGGRTEVLNQSQIAATIAAGVHRTLSASGVRAGGSYSLSDGSNEDILYRAFRRALDETDFGGDVELDGDTIYRAMVRRNRANTRLTGVNAMA